MHVCGYQTQVWVYLKSEILSKKPIWERSTTK
jgi:hypothetical protein